MLNRIWRLFNRFLRNSRTINNEPLNPVNLIVIILVDIFILVNVFVGLEDISQWYISPSQAYPCYAEWSDYQKQTSKDKDFNLVRSAFTNENFDRRSLQQRYQQGGEGHLGSVSPTCLNYASAKDKINTPENQAIGKSIAQKQANIDQLNQSNRTIRAQYDSTLLEKLAGQSRDQSINVVGAEKARETLDENNRKISTLNQEVTTLKNELIAKPESANFLGFIKNDNQLKDVEQGYQRSTFWYPTIQLAFQAFFLLPLIFVAFTVHRLARRKGYGLVALISWHLLVIFFIPLILKIFQFLQVGALFQFIFDVIKAIFGGLLFLVSYVYILLIPLVGFGLIKLFQRFVVNVKLQAANRVQKSHCIRCDRTIRAQDSYCPHCGYYQYVECHNCHELTYQYLPYCKHCGHSQEEPELGAGS
jgi:predicted RNA-binding Zn-ribbon protein involved in translation (DUF1610 family)